MAALLALVATFLTSFLPGPLALLVEYWVDADHLGILRQLGTVPLPGQEQPGTCWRERSVSWKSLRKRA
jgi:hypothetical protein